MTKEEKTREEETGRGKRIGKGRSGDEKAVKEKGTGKGATKEVETGRNGKKEARKELAESGVYGRLGGGAGKDTASLK